jgi:hypothetical protein
MWVGDHSRCVLRWSIRYGSREDEMMQLTDHFVAAVVPAVRDRLMFHD